MNTTAVPVLWGAKARRSGTDDAMRDAGKARVRVKSAQFWRLARPRVEIAAVPFCSEETTRMCVGPGKCANSRRVSLCAETAGGWYR